MANHLSMAVPYGADQTLYLVVDSFAARGSDYREVEIEYTNLEAIVSDLLSGQFNAPVRVLAFNTLEHWVKDMSNQVAEEIQSFCDIERVPVPEHVRDFVARHISATRQLQLT
jgi:hypothetical protein